MACLTAARIAAEEVVGVAALKTAERKGRHIAFATPWFVLKSCITARRNSYVGDVPLTMRAWRRLMTLAIIGCMVGLASAVIVPASAQTPDRFIEINLPDGTDTFDLSTLKEVRPGRFVVMKIAMERPDLMEFEINALRKLKDYCSSPVGSYPVSDDLLKAGAPDEPVDKIEVKPGPTGYGAKPKMVQWKYPYKKFAWLNGTPRSMLYRCWSKTEFMDQYNLLTNGLHTQEIYDCRNALTGWVTENDPANPMMMEVRQDTIGAGEYIRVCAAVYQGKPHNPWP